MSLQDKHQVMDIEKIRDSIKRKHRAITHNIQETQQFVEKHFKPITDPLKQLVKKKETAVDDDLREQPSPASYIEQSIRATKNEFDHTYGLKFNPNINRWTIGKKQVEIGEDSVTIDTHNYKATAGLLQLLFMNVPVGYTEEDLLNYKEILEISGAHLNVIGQVKRNKSNKYRQVIKGLFPPIVAGSGMFMIEDLPNSVPTKYLFWDDPNELCDRLRMLLYSKRAGHTGHEGEIASIIEELKEKKIILGGGNVSLF